MSKTKKTVPNLPSKKQGKPSGPGRGNADPKPKVVKKGN